MTTSPKPQRAPQPKPPKAWRAEFRVYNGWNDGNVYRVATETKWPKSAANCTVYPDGAPLPLPPAMRRVLRAARALEDVPLVGRESPSSHIYRVNIARERLKAALDALSPPVRGGRGQR